MIPGLEFVLAFLCGVADRIRGGYPSHAFWWNKPEWVDDYFREAVKFIYGCLLMLLLTDVWWQVLAAGPLWWLGTRQDFGSMFRVYRSEAGGWMNTIRVGAVWALPVVLGLVWWNLEVLWMFPAAVFGTYFGHLIARSVPVVLPAWCLELETGPAWSEFYRGLLTALFLIGVSYAAG